ncbi:MAG: hypothetical protein JW958_00070 [Candidatus Eisenbacteria bacterium]|nr:hypothetical protein [Candidatus Eisenbacteria bacterium]
MRNRFFAITGGVLLLALVLALGAGCGGKGEGEEQAAISQIPDSLETFAQKIAWLIPQSFQSLEFACANKADQKIDAAINLKAYVPAETFFSLFEGIDVAYRNLYYGWETFGAVYPVDPQLPMDSTMVLLQLEARSRLVEQIRLVEEQVGNITDEAQRLQVEKDLDEMRATLKQVEEGGVRLYGAEVRALPNDLKSIMFRPEGLVRVIFPGIPQEGSWVRISPTRLERLLQAPPPQSGS